jgi:hypothetical protein
MASSIYMYRSADATARRRLFALTLTGAILAGLVYLRLFNPAGSNLYPSCPFYAWTGFYCPGCGTLRGLHQLLHGHLAAAFGLNPLMVLMLPLMIYVFISYALVGIRGRGLPGLFLPPPLIWALFWILMSYWVLRNIPLYPFNLLAP